MKTFNSIIIFIISIVFQFCNSNIKKNDPIKSNNLSWTQDTVNKTDVNGHKQGRWIITERIIIEEGSYKDNKREGFWKHYNSDGSIKDSIEYKNDVPLSK